MKHLAGTDTQTLGNHSFIQLRFTKACYVPYILVGAENIAGIRQVRAMVFTHLHCSEQQYIHIHKKTRVDEFKLT